MVGGTGGGELVVTFAGWMRRSAACCSSRVISWLSTSMSAGALRPDSRQPCSPGAVDQVISPGVARNAEPAPHVANLPPATYHARKTQAVSKSAGPRSPRQLNWLRDRAVTEFREASGS